MTIDSRITERKQRWLDFYDLSRPHRNLIRVQDYSTLGHNPWPRPDCVEARIEWAWRKYNLQMDQLDWLPDDTLPCLEVYTGTEIFAQAFGCHVYYPDDNMPFALPLVHSAQEADALPVPSLDTPPLIDLFRIADELHRRAGQEALLRLVDVQSPMDIAALIWDKLSFYPAMAEAPEAVHLLSHKVHTLLTAFFDEWFARYGKEFIAHYPDYYMPFGLSLSEDEVGAVSGRMFEQFFLPELVALSDRYGALGMHCCANARHQWAHFKKIPNLRLLNLIQSGPIIRQSLDFFAGHVAQWPIPQGGEMPWTDLANPHPTARLVIEYFACSRDDALTFMEHMLGEAAYLDL
jgi:hypothetical protein